MQRAIPKNKIIEAVSLLGRKRTVVAPVRRGDAHVFAAVSDPAAVDLSYRTTILPLKKFFLPPLDVLLRYEMGTQHVEVPAQAEASKLFFGIHNYDLHGLRRLDHAFAAGVRDETWISRRNGSLFVGVSYVPDDYHFAASVGIPPEMKEGFDAFLTEAGDTYRVESLTDAGAGLLKELSALLVPAGDGGETVAHFRNQLHRSVSGIREIFPGAYTSPVWQETAQRCHSCGTCNMVCPTCYCFDVDDQTDLGAATGSRLRRWDSCQFPGFAAVAGGESFRDKRQDRVRHRMARKFAFMADDAGRPFCVGCGRCVRQCTAKINIVDVINALL